MNTSLIVASASSQDLNLKDPPQKSKPKSPEIPEISEESTATEASSDEFIKFKHSSANLSEKDISVISDESKITGFSLNTSLTNQTGVSSIATACTSNFTGQVSSIAAAIKDVGDSVLANADPLEKLEREKLILERLSVKPTEDLPTKVMTPPLNMYNSLNSDDFRKMKTAFQENSEMDKDSKCSSSSEDNKDTFKKVAIIGGAIAAITFFTLKKLDK